MINQRKISSFFSRRAVAPSTSKHTTTMTDISNTEETSSSNGKRSRNDNCSEEPIQKKKSNLLLGYGFQNPVSFEKTWKSALKTEFSKPYYVKLEEFVNEERLKSTIYPAKDQVFSWMHHCRIHDVKVVILGQDPYHGPKQAHGLCFSVQKGVASPPSLVNIFRELMNDVGFEDPGHGDLTGWAKQGVLLLNAVLTVRAGQANSHKDKGWEKFTDAVISYINTNLTGVVFILWGSYAQKKGARINKKRHLVLKEVHPSPLSAYRGFFGCKHFSKANEYLKKQGKEEIKWSQL